MSEMFRADRSLVIRAGKDKWFLNPNMLDRQDCWENLGLIKELFADKHDLFERLKVEECPLVLVLLDQELVEIEFKIQEAFKFERDSRFHRFWERPKCGCPKLDNYDKWGTKFSIVSSECELHGV